MLRALLQGEGLMGGLCCFVEKALRFLKGVLVSPRPGISVRVEAFGVVNFIAYGRLKPVMMI